MREPYRVLRPFGGPGGQRYAAGDVVDAAGWRWKTQLVERRMIEKLPEPPATGEAVGAHRGRRGTQPN